MSVLNTCSTPLASVDSPSGKMCKAVDTRMEIRTAVPTHGPNSTMRFLQSFPTTRSTSCCCLSASSTAATKRSASVPLSGISKPRRCNKNNYAECGCILELHFHRLKYELTCRPPSRYIEQTIHNLSPTEKNCRRHSFLIPTSYKQQQ